MDGRDGENYARASGRKRNFHRTTRVTDGAHPPVVDVACSMNGFAERACDVRYGGTPGRCRYCIRYNGCYFGILSFFPACVRSTVRYATSNVQRATNNNYNAYLYMCEAHICMIVHVHCRQD